MYYASDSSILPYETEPTVWLVIIMLEHHMSHDPLFSDMLEIAYCTVLYKGAVKGVPVMKSAIDTALWRRKNERLRHRHRTYCMQTTVKGPLAFGYAARKLEIYRFRNKSIPVSEVSERKCANT